MGEFGFPVLGRCKDLRREMLERRAASSHWRDIDGKPEMGGYVDDDNKNNIKKVRAGAFPVSGSVEQQAKSGISPIPSVIAASVRISATLGITLGPAQSSPAADDHIGRGSKRLSLRALAHGSSQPARGGRAPGMLRGRSGGAWERASHGGTGSPEPPPDALTAPQNQQRYGGVQQAEALGDSERCPRAGMAAGRAVCRDAPPAQPGCTPKPRQGREQRDAGADKGRESSERCPRAGTGAGTGSARIPRLQPCGRPCSSGKGCAGTGRAAPGRELNE